MVNAKKSPKKMDSDAIKGPVSAADSAMRTSGNLLMTYEDLERELGICRQTIWRKIACGKMPKPIRLGWRTVRFRRQDIEEWVAGGCKSNRAKKVG